MTGPKRPPANRLAPLETKTAAPNAKQVDNKNSPRAPRKSLLSKRPASINTTLASQSAIALMSSVEAGEHKAGKVKLKPIGTDSPPTAASRMTQIQEAISRKETELLASVQTEPNSPIESQTPTSGRSPAAIRRQHVEQMASLRAVPVLPPLRVDVAATLRQKSSTPSPREEPVTPKAPQNTARAATLPPGPKGSRGLFNPKETTLHGGKSNGPSLPMKKFRRGG